MRKQGHAMLEALDVLFAGRPLPIAWAFLAVTFYLLYSQFVTHISIAISTVSTPALIMIITVCIALIMTTADYGVWK